jgi:hypothetical protein
VKHFALIYNANLFDPQIFSGEPPFGSTTDDIVFTLIVDRKVRPPRPTEEPIHQALNNALWKLLRECWSHHAKERPDVNKIASCLQSIHSVPDLDNHIQLGNWMMAHKVIDTSKIYLIKNHATGRFWSYIKTVPFGYAVCGRTMHPGIPSWFKVCGLKSLIFSSNTK